MANLAEFFSIKGQLGVPAGFEWIILLIIIAIIFLFGPAKIPELARSVGKALGEFRRGKMEVEREIQKELREAEKTEVRISETMVQTAARSLGIPPENKKDYELRLEIARKLPDQPNDRVVACAKALGVPVEGIEIKSIRENIIKTLGV